MDLAGKEAGPRGFYNYRGKNIVLVVQGRRPLTEGLRVVASHIDSPRLDLKQYPLYEDTDLAFLKTHYYGGIKKYQWLARPLAIHGVVLKADGSRVQLTIGEDPNDPVFSVLDLLPHLARKLHMDKKVSEAFEGEKLNVLVGSLPLGDAETKERVKLHLLKYLEDHYGIQEEDLISAELEVVPAGPARDLGWDRSLVGGYGQDDRSCAYASLAAILDVQEPEHTCVALFYDKEEIGSEGNTGARSFLLNEIVETPPGTPGRKPPGPAPGAHGQQGPVGRRHRGPGPGFSRGAREKERRPDGLRRLLPQVRRQRRQVLHQRRQRRVRGLDKEDFPGTRGRLAGGAVGQGGRRRRRHHRQVPGGVRHGDHRLRHALALHALAL